MVEFKDYSNFDYSKVKPATVLKPDYQGLLKESNKLYNTINASVTINEAIAKEANLTIQEIDANPEYEGFVKVSSYLYKGRFSELDKVLRKIAKNVDDLSPLFRIFSKWFFDTNKKLVFSQYSEGQTPYYKSIDPTTRYGIYKTKIKGSTWPLLVLGGELEMSLTIPTDPNAINRIFKKSMKVGTKIEYASSLAKQGRDPVRYDLGDRPIKWLKIAKEFLSNVSQKDLT